ncbi:MAG: hypothetical protein [Asgard archaea virus SkuldV2]|nr:MAG: hypothetical protein [Asgard archaea virus SkuldV2]
MKIKQIEAIREIYKLGGAVSDKLNAIVAIASDPKNKVLTIFLDPKLTIEQKLNEIYSSIQLTEKTIRKWRKYAQLIGTACLVIYTFLQTIGLI